MLLTPSISIYIVIKLLNFTTIQKLMVNLVKEKAGIKVQASISFFFIYLLINNFNGQ